MFDKFVEKNRIAKREQKNLTLTLFREGNNKNVNKDFNLDASKGKKAFIIGGTRHSDVYLDNNEIIDDIHCVIKFDEEKSCWYIEEVEETLNGTFICCKNYEEFINAQKDLSAHLEQRKICGIAREKLYKPTRKQLMQKGMLCYFSDHILEVL